MDPNPANGATIKNCSKVVVKFGVAKAAKGAALSRKNVQIF
jgi:hypothetical protein